MTDARDRLAQGLEILMARPYSGWHLKEAAATIAAFVEERVQTEALARHNQDLQRDKTILHHAERLRAAEQRLEAVENTVRYDCVHRPWYRVQGDGTAAGRSDSQGDPSVPEPEGGVCAGPPEGGVRHADGAASVQPAPAACEWWLVLAGDGDVLEVFAFEDDAHRWATEQDAAIVDGPPHCVVRVVSAGNSEETNDAE